MSDERSFLHLSEFWDNCDDHFEQSGGGSEVLKQRDEVEFIAQLLQTGQSFTSDRNGIGMIGRAPSPQIAEETSIQEPVQAPLPPPAPVTAAVPKPACKAKSSTGNSKTLKHKCETCSQVFDSKIALSIHTGRIHKHEGRDKNYQCTRCSKAFFNSSYLAQHMRIHTGHKPYPCDKCDKRFTQLSHLQQHKRTHTGEKPYKCQQPGCSKAFSQLSNLQSHSRSHLPDGNVHKCTSCYKCYFDEASLNTHLRTHMVNKRDRNYRCEECGKSYTQDTYLQNHINNKHGRTPIDSMGFNPRPMRQPTSIQAATSMICKLEEPSTPCGIPPSSQHTQPAPGMISKLMSSTQLLGPTAYQQDASYDLQRVIPSAFNPGVTERSVYQENSSAFKPVVRPGFDAMESISSRDSEISRQGSRSYDQQNSLVETLPMMPPVDMKSNIESEPQDTEMYWRIRSNVAASLGGYSSLSSHIQNYMASQPNYQSYAAYMNSPLDPLHSDKSNMYNGDAMTDYLMGGGLREAYQME